MTDRDDQETQFLEIDTGRKRRWFGWVGYILFFVIVAAALIFFFVQLNTSFRLAAGLVIFMVAYMAIMGWFASGKLDRRE